MRGTIRKRERRDGSIAYQWQATVRDAGRRRHLTGTEHTKCEAERALRAAILEWEKKPLSVDRRKLTFANYASEIIDGLKQRGELRPSTVASYRSNLRLHVFPSLGELRLCDINETAITRLYGRLHPHGRRDKKAGGLSATTVNYIHRIVHRVLDEAVQEGALATNPATRAKRPKAKKPDIAYWTPDEVQVFLSTVEGDRLATLYRSALTTGLRRGELLGLQWSDLDLVERRLTVSRALVDVEHEVIESAPKTRAGERTIAIDDESRRALSSLRRAQLEERLAAGEAWADMDYVFTNQLGDPLHPNAVAHAFRRAVERSGLRRIPFHGLRHTHATAALAAGVPAKVVQERLGHSSITVTLDRYAHVMPRQDQDAADRKAALFQAAN